jgi:succinoglycan biosynthesis protein ExoA
MPEAQTVPVSVVVPCRNEIRHIRAFLDSVFRQKLGRIELEILVADGMSEDGTRAVLNEYEKKYPILRVIENPEKIASTALNRAIREARGEIIVRMDAHSVYAPDYIHSCVEVLNETKADNVGGMALTHAEGFISLAIAHAFQTPFARGGAKFRDPRYDGPVDSVPYGCWRKTTLELIGLFDEGLVRSQDYELNARLVSSGGIVWQSPRIISWYRPRTTLKGLFWQYFQYGFWKYIVIRKHAFLATWRNLAPAFCFIGVVVLSLGAAAASLAGSALWRNMFLTEWFAFVGIYFAASLTAAFYVAKREGWRFFPILPFAFAAYHLSYALGFLLALFHRPACGLRPGAARNILTAITR